MSTIDLLILGNVNVDLILGPLDEWPQEGTERLVNQMQWRVGGNAGNAALACAALNTDFLTVSPVGDDLPGRWIKEQIPLDMTHWLPSEEPTSVSVAVTHPNGERTFITHLGHLNTLHWTDLKPHLPHCRAVLLAGAFLTPALRAEYPEVLRHFQAQGSQVAVDFGWPDGGFTPEVQGEVRGWLPLVHHLLINELEAQHLSGQASTTEALRTLAAQLHPQGTVVIKCGSAGVVAQYQGKQYAQSAPTVTVLDSVGAGDTWNAAYLHALLTGQEIENALAYAVNVASTAISTQPRVFPPLE